MPQSFEKELAEKTSDDKDRPAQSPKTGFPLVGIGASAGGLEAFSELLSNLTDSCGMALLIVQHLDPDHPSMLTEILAKRTAMPVVEATEHQLIEKNKVYVIPPNTSMTVTQGYLTLKARESIHGVPMPVDDLFHSLAEDQGANAVGVSLSGSGSDGALGIQAIKNEGGITFAQTESTAKFNSMPQAAISRGFVDFILSPKEIAEKLESMGQRPVIASHPMLLNVDHVAADDVNLNKIFQILNAVYKHDFTHYKRGTLTRRMTRRVAMLNLNSLEEYIRFLNANPEEVRLLYQDLLIRVTSFFRDPEAFEGLNRKVFPELIEQCAPGDAIRIWVPGCSTGEEVYSIAITLVEFLKDRAAGTKIQIFGTDVSESALTTARAGIYFESIANDVSAERLKRFFSKNNGKYKIAKSLRNLCVFANHNVTSDPPFSQLDLISCRNVLIYFDPTLQKRVISLFHYALKPGGSLILGPSETIGASSDIFTLTHGKKYNIFSKRLVPSRSHLDYLKGEKSSPVHKLVPKPSVTGTPEKQRNEIDRIALARYVPAGVLCDDELNILEFRGDTGPYLIQPSGPPANNLRELARLGLFVEINNMIGRARKDLVPVRRTAQRVEMRDGIREVDLEVIPIMQDIDNPMFLVFFEHPNSGGKIKGQQSSSLWDRLRSGFISQKPAKPDDIDVQRLQQELDSTRQYIMTMSDEHNAALEELRSSQEELMSSNEEFQSTNEELETAKEELQSSNEELITTNDELMHRNEELNNLNIEMEHAKNYAQAIVETAREPLVVLDENLRIVRANTAFHRTFKLDVQETIGCLFYELDAKQWDIPALRQLLSEVLPKDESFENCEITNEFPRIGQKTMMLNGRHLAWDKQALILLALEDISDFKAAQHELKEAARRKDEFLAMLAHELRNPLAPIRNALEIWQRGDAGPEAEHQAQLIMDRQLRKETRLVDDLLDIARITQGSIVLKEELVDLRQIAQQAVEGTEHQYKARNHKLVLDLPDNSANVRGDPVRLEQIVSNLLSNAAKYTEPGGHISITLAAENDQAVLSVKDNGIGIDHDLLSRVFDLFVQADASLDRSQGGLGIGLTLVHRLVELQGGTIDVKSDEVNAGSEFIVCFPIACGSAATATKAPSEETPTKNRPATHQRILVVDDNMDSADTSALLLRLEGHDVRAVYDGPQALAMANDFRPAIILLDIGLPEMDGYEVARRLRQMPEHSGVQLIAVSGYSPTEEHARANEGCFDHHLMKPVDMEKLRALFAPFEDQTKI